MNFRRAALLRPRSVAILALILICGAGLLRLDSLRSRHHASKSANPAEVSANYGRLPLIFEANQGQTDTHVKFEARGAGYGLYLTKDAAVLALHSASGNSVVQMSLDHANLSELDAEQQLPGKSNYFVGNNPALWHRDIPQYARIAYRQVYPGIDLVYYGRQGKLEYDFEVAPGADPSQIAMQFRGPKKLTLTPAGDLLLAAASGDNVQLHAPRVYQKNSAREVAGKFRLQADNRVTVQIGEYDRSQTLIIDPVLTYSTYLGGSGSESCSAIEQAQFGFTNAQFTPGCPTIAVDSASRAYIAGATTSPTFPTIVPGTSTSYQTCLDAPSASTCPGSQTNSDVFVVRLNASGTAIDFATYLGGSGSEVTAGIAVDQNFNVHVAGTTNSANFPTLATSYQPAAASAGTHAFVSEIGGNGSALPYSTYLSGTGVDIASGIAVDNLGKEYVTGTTTSPAFPTTATAWQLTPKATNQFFFSKLDPTITGPTGLLYSTYIGGSTPSTGVAMGGGIAVDSSCNAYLTGGTNFADLATQNASQGTKSGGIDAWVAKFSVPTGSACGSQLILTYLTYFGGSGNDVGYGIAVDSSSNAYITGSTTSPDIVRPTNSGGVSFAKCLDQPPQTAVAYPATCPAISGTPPADAFLAKLGSLTSTATSGTNVPYLYFTYLGGTSEDTGTAVTANSTGSALVTGWTKSGDFPAATVLTTAPLQSAFGGVEDAFLTRIDTTTSCTPVASTTAPVNCPGFSTFFGGSGTDIGTGVAIDAQNGSYFVGETSSPNFPVASAAYPTLNGPTDAFVSKLSPVPVLTLTPTAPLSTTVVGVGNSVAFTYTLINTGDPATGVIVTDTLPAASATFTSMSVSQGSCGAAVGVTVTCSVGALNTGATVTVTVNLTPTASTTPSVNPGALSNTLSASAPGAATSTTSSTAVVHDFNIAIQPGSPASVTVPAGVPANFTFVVSGALNTFPDSISLSATAGLPTATTTSWTTNPIPTLSGSAQTSVLTITTTARVTTTGYVLRNGGELFAIWLPVSAMAFLGLGIGGTMSRKRKLTLGLVVAGFFTLVLLQAGCGSKKSTSTTTGTPAGTYIITVNATSGTAVRTTTVTLVVQ